MPRLSRMTVNDFVEQLSAGTPSPGGGSAAALCGAMAAALGGLVSRLTLSKEAYEQSWEVMERVRDETASLSDRLVYLMEEDTNAYLSFIEAGGLPSETPEEEEIKEQMREQMMKKAVVVPLEVLRCCQEILPLLRDVAALGARVAVNDGMTGLCLLRATAVASCLTILTNLPRLYDENFCSSVQDEALSLMYDITSEIDRANEHYVNALLKLRE
ncbi:MAG: cyclodeaminase/cyclohydrolase family protein [Aminobacterium sp.]|uniref:cyclodeaminase/cyclohydrolase family protein n=1 Tax=Aminobacterium sp. TaxID=1872491 RepID=UPI002B1FF3F6|nr:cyclodeaminase/cyclohydrolase family protein [Aminobacterium sp.]MEA4877069.1 cyclodeaminase/cyclohydrolase family protein [Aminobacterium sp.]